MRGSQVCATRPRLATPRKEASLICGDVAACSKPSVRWHCDVPILNPSPASCRAAPLSIPAAVLTCLPNSGEHATRLCSHAVCKLGRSLLALAPRDLRALQVTRVFIAASGGTGRRARRQQSSARSCTCLHTHHDNARMIMGSIFFVAPSAASSMW
jgi:hypothetical protein